MSLTKKDKEEIVEIIKHTLTTMEAGRLAVEEGNANYEKTKQPDFDSWKKNGIKSKLAGVIVAPEDYFEGNKKFFTWDEAVAASVTPNFRRKENR